MNVKDFEGMAKLDLPEAERRELAAQAETLVQPFSEVDKVDTSGVKPLISVLDIQNVLREDIAQKNFSRDELLANAPEQYDGYFQVPKTMD